MKFKIKDMDIATGGPLIAIINNDDAVKLDLHHLDRIKIRKGSKIETVSIDIAESSKSVPNGYLGVFEEVIESLKLKDNELVDISLAKKPLSLEFIKKKLDGIKLSKIEINQIVYDIVHNKLSDVELTFFVAACYTNVMSLDETIWLTKAMASHGDILKLKKYPVIDKHCVGGLSGNRTTMVIVPIIAAAGYTMPKTSSRSITSPAGTADTMEILSNVSFPIQKMKRIVEKTNACIVWGGALNLAPADDKIIRVERPLSIDAESQLLASIMAKKHSVSSTHIIIDIPMGPTAKIKNKIEAFKLKREFEKIGKKLNKHIKVVITDGSQPIGNGIGPALEARDVLWVLMRDKRRPLDLERKCVMMCGAIFELVGIKNGEKKAMDILDSGAAFMKMKQIILAQGGNPDINPEDLPVGQCQYIVKASKKGIVRKINNEAISKIARVSGAPKNKGAGILLHRHVGDPVRKGEPLFTIFAESTDKLAYAKEVLREIDGYAIK